MTAVLRLCARLLRRIAPRLFQVIQQLRSIYFLLSRPIRRRILALQLLLFASTIFGMVATLSAVPFLMVVINEDISQVKFLAHLIAFSGLQERHEIIWFLGLSSFALMALSAASILLITFAYFRLNIQVNLDFFQKLFDYYLDESYEFHSTKNSAMLVHNTKDRLNGAIQGIIHAIMNLNNSLVLFVISIGFMLLIDPLLAVSGTLVIGILLGIVITRSRGYAKRLNIEIVRKGGAVNSMLIESMRLHEDFTLIGRKREISGTIRQLRYSIDKSNMKLQAISMLFPATLELAIYGTLILMISGFAYFSPELQLVGAMATFTLILYRLKPHITTVFSAYLNILGGLTNFDVIGNDLTTSLQHTPHPRERRRLPFNHSIDFINVDYCYPGVPEPAISSTSLSLACGQHIGFCGPSGGGKSTLLKLVLGFVRPSSGQLLIDGQELSQDNVRQWYNIVGYVSQSTHFTDGTIADNILLGRERNDTAGKRIWQCLEMVQLKTFIKALDSGVDTLIGEDGIQLSGGQQQRLLIARALYADPEILIFDEATSSLDYATEADIMACIKEVFKDKTVLMVAHRLSTIADCDMLHYIEDGRVQSSGSYRELMEQSAAFKALVEAGLSEAAAAAAGGAEGAEPDPALTAPH